MTEKYRDLCFCQAYRLKSDVEDLLDFFHIDSFFQKKKVSIKDAKQVLNPSIRYQTRVGEVEGYLRGSLRFSPKQYLDRARELVTKTKMSRVAKSFVQFRKEYSKKYLEAESKNPTSIHLTLHLTHAWGSGFTPDIIPRVFKVKLIKSNLEFFLKKVYRRSVHGYVCPDFLYDASKFNFVGGIVPARLPVPKLISNKLGEPSVDAITLTFQDSPIGIEEVTITKENEHLVLELKMARRVNNFKDLYPKILNETKEIAELMLERVT